MRGPSEEDIWSDDIEADLEFLLWYFDGNQTRFNPDKMSCADLGKEPFGTLTVDNDIAHTFSRTRVGVDERSERTHQSQSALKAGPDNWLKSFHRNFDPSPCLECGGVSDVEANMFEQIAAARQPGCRLLKKSETSAHRSLTGSTWMEPGSWERSRRVGVGPRAPWSTWRDPSRKPTKLDAMPEDVEVCPVRGCLGSVRD